jgi:hypothetical protein
MTDDLKFIWYSNVSKKKLESGEVTIVNGVEGKPKSSPPYWSEEQLAETGMVGIYRRRGDESFRVINKGDSPEPQV